MRTMSQRSMLGKISGRSAFVYSILVAVLLLLVAMVAQPWLWKWVHNESFPQSVQNLHWILGCIIAILSFAVALYGILAYQVLKHTLRENLEQTIANEAKAALARSFGNIGFCFWRNWLMHRRDEPMLEGALNAERCALTLMDSIGPGEYPELSIRSQYQIYSNFCAYVAYKGLAFGVDKVANADVTRAREVGLKAYEAAQQLGKEPDWIANYLGFMNTFGTSAEKAEAKRLMVEIKQRSDVPDEDYNEYLEFFADAHSTLRREN